MALMIKIVNAIYCLQNRRQRLYRKTCLLQLYFKRQDSLLVAALTRDMPPRVTAETDVIITAISVISSQTYIISRTDPTLTNITSIITNLERDVQLFTGIYT